MSENDTILVILGVLWVALLLTMMTTLFWRLMSTTTTAHLAHWLRHHFLFNLSTSCSSYCIWHPLPILGLLNLISCLWIVILAQEVIHMLIFVFVHHLEPTSVATIAIKGVLESVVLGWIISFVRTVKRISIWRGFSAFGCWLVNFLLSLSLRLHFEVWETKDLDAKL